MNLGTNPTSRIVLLIGIETFYSEEEETRLYIRGLQSLTLVKTMFIMSMTCCE